ncbi:serine hydrolase domain-containing protein [Azorhizobium sp. AG788]|uniref:serine hydrolase domain-containing protein n=1 Tax=Azorhizobium sp. AG788 TaxID=2183897 RepID=UPI003139B7AA
MAADTLPTDAEISAVLTTRVETERRASGIVVGVIDAQGRRVIACGAPGSGGRPLDGKTAFEIGSVTKVFTSLLLADMVRCGEVALDDPAATYLPPGMTLPERDGTPITLLDLATHTSGLPRLPGNLKPRDPADPYAGYSDAKLYDGLRGARLNSPPGAAYVYSNLGAGLLGQLLARRAGLPYADLITARITGPLGLTDTAITLSPEQTLRRAVGHDEGLSPVGSWTMDSLAGAGGLSSTADDLLVFLAAALGYDQTPLHGAMADQLVPRRPAGAGTLVALGWHISPIPGGEIVWHNGGTGGFRSFVGFDRARSIGVVVLVDTASAVGGDDIALHLLAGAPLSKPAPVRQAVAAGARFVERCVGRYLRRRG